MHILSVGQHVCALRGDDLPSLKPLILEATGQNVRRIDRFIQLALLGAGRCCKGRKLPPGAALYLTSERGDIEVTVEIFQTLYLEKQPPRPLSFVNSVSNAACFYLATGLELSGGSQFIATHRFGFERALQLAMLDMKSGRADTALIGCVDVCVPPLRQHRVRIGVEADAPIAEASHWMLMRSEAVAGETLGELIEVKSFARESELLPWLKSFSVSEPLTLAFGLGLNDDQKAAVENVVSGCTLWGGECGGSYSAYYDGLAAGVCADFAARGSSGHLLHVARDTEGRYCAYHMRKAP